VTGLHQELYQTYSGRPSHHVVIGATKISGNNFT